MRLMLAGVAIAAALAASGCDAPRSRVHGTVTYQGKPLAGAVVTLFGADNLTHTADTGPDGRYEVSGVRRGTVRVSVQMPPPPQRARPDPVPGKGSNTPATIEDAAKAARLPPAPPPTAVPPPAGSVAAKYSDPNTSGLSFELKEPDQEYAIELK